MPSLGPELEPHVLTMMDYKLAMLDFALSTDLASMEAHKAITDTKRGDIALMGVTLSPDEFRTVNKESADRLTDIYNTFDGLTGGLDV